jgi:hypothetical protein
VGYRLEENSQPIKNSVYSGGGPIRKNEVGEIVLKKITTKKRKCPPSPMD